MTNERWEVAAEICVIRKRSELLEETWRRGKLPHRNECFNVLDFSSVPLSPPSKTFSDFFTKTFLSIWIKETAPDSRRHNTKAGGRRNYKHFLKMRMDKLWNQMKDGKSSAAWSEFCIRILVDGRVFTMKCSVPQRTTQDDVFLKGGADLHPDGQKPWDSWREETSSNTDELWAPPHTHTFRKMMSTWEPQYPPPSPSVT